MGSSNNDGYTLDVIEKDIESFTIHGKKPLIQLQNVSFDTICVNVSDCLHTDPAVQERLDGGINLPKTVNRIRAALPGIHRMSRRLPRKGETHTQNGITILVVICVVTLTQVLMLAYSQRRRHEDLDERLDRLENKLDA